MIVLLEVLWKSLIVFLMLLVLTRLIGRKLLSQLNFFEYVIGIIIGTITGAYVVNAIEGAWVLLSPIVLTLINMLLSYINSKSLFFRKIIEGEPVILIQNGKLMEKNFEKLRYHLDDLEMQLRNKDIFNIAEVEFAVLEPDGKLSVLKKSQNQPLTPSDLKLDTKYKGLATELVKNGKILEQNLKQNNLSLGWLFNELYKHNISNISDVMYASLNTDGSIYIDVREDKLDDYVQKVED